MRIQVCMIFIHTVCSLKLLIKILCSSLCRPFLSNFDINLCVLQMYLMNLISMLNIAYYLPMNQKTL